MSQSTIKNKLNRYSKTELVEKLLKNILSSQEQKKDSDSIISKLEDKVKKIEKELKVLRAMSIETLTDEETMKEVLKLKATGKSTNRIYEVLADNRGINISLSEVRSICENIDDMSEELKSFYNLQKKIYFENLSFDKENILLEDIQTVNGMIDSSRKVLENMEDEVDSEDFSFDDYRKLQDHISKLIKNKNDILKVITGGGDPDDTEEFEIKYAAEESEELDIEIVNE